MNTPADPENAVPLTAAVIGASGGIGSRIVSKLTKDARFGRIYAFSRSAVPREGDSTTYLRLDLEDEPSIAAAAARTDGTPLNLVVVASGFLHGEQEHVPEKSMRHLEGASLAHSFAVNAIGPALVAKHFLPRLDRRRRSVFAALSARVGSISDNRLGGWHGYRASKAALNMLIRNFAIETRPVNPQAVVVGLHPGTVDTPLSEPFQKHVPEGKLFTPELAAGHLQVIDQLSPDDSGHVLAWDGQRVPA